MKKRFYKLPGNSNRWLDMTSVVMIEEAELNGEPRTHFHTTSPSEPTVTVSGHHGKALAGIMGWAENKKL